MTVETVREFCLGLRSVTEGFPFGEDALVFKTGGKMFALLSLEGKWLNLKCDPDEAAAIREKYAAVTPGYHMNKKHWNTIMLDGTVPDRILEKWITDSYQLVEKPGRRRHGHL